MTVSTNPLRIGLPRERVPDPCVFAIFGGTGDLAQKKLLPATYHLYLEGLLPRAFSIICYASNDFDDDAYRDFARKAIKKAAPHAQTEGQVWEGFARMLHYCSRGENGDPLQRLKTRIEEIAKPLGAEDRVLFYFAIPPTIFGSSAEALRDAGLTKPKNEHGWRRLIVEKPFGTDLQSAKELNATLQSIFREPDIYRIDHYLGKETVQNILVLRFANEFAEPLLNREHVDHVQITVAESIGVEKRGAFYDATGALRDIVQNHMLQVMATTLMDQPASLDAEAVRDAKVKLISSIVRVEPHGVPELAVRGQYGAGLMLGQRVASYREEENIGPDSLTETYVALKLAIDNDRWRGVPIYLRTGKRLAKRVSEVGIQLKCAGSGLFGCDMPADVIAINIQPDDGISIRFEAKVPGFSDRVQPVRMDFRYASAFGPSTPDAYERLLLDAFLGDASLYARADAVEAAWSICDPILEGWKRDNVPLPAYAPGTWGPKEADNFIARDGRQWRRL